MAQVTEQQVLDALSGVVDKEKNRDIADKVWAKIEAELGERETAAPRIVVQ